MTQSETVSLKEFLLSVVDERHRGYEQRFEAQEKAVQAALAAAGKATDAALAAADRLASKAEEFADEKLASHNQIKPWVQSGLDSLKDRTSGIESALNSRIDAVERRIARFEDREKGVGLSAKVVMWAAVFLATILGIIGWFLLHH